MQNLQPIPRILIVFASEGMLHTFVFYMGLTQYRGRRYEYRCQGLPPIWLSVVDETQSLAPVLEFAARNRLNVHNYTRRGISGPGGLQTVQQWLGNTGQSVRQRYGEQVTWFLQRALPNEHAVVYHAVTTTTVDEDAELQSVLNHSLETYDAGRKSPSPAWVEPLRCFKSEPAVPGVHPLCVSCLVSRASVAFVDCGHQVICDECACAFWSQPEGFKKQCLICRKPIQHAPVHLIPSEPLAVDQAMV